MEYACISSGSDGNCAVVKHLDTLLMIDCGLTTKETVRRLSHLDLTPQQLDGIIVTHEHRDHLSGVAPLARRYHLPVWMTHGTYRCARDQRIDQLSFYRAEQLFTIGHCDLIPFTVPHDAAETCQFVVATERQRLAILTDLGTTTPHIIEHLQDIHGIVLECNHDEEMLYNGPYAAGLKRRVAGNFGHLSNRQAADLLKRIDSKRLEFILLAHLSRQNNTKEKALQAIAAILEDGSERVSVLSQSNCNRWFTLGEASAIAT